MKRSHQRMPKTLNRNASPSDLTDEQWAILEPLVPAISEDAASHVHARREMVNGLTGVFRRQKSWKLSHQFFRGSRAQIFEHGMPTKTIVKTLGLFKNGLSGLGSALKVMTVNTLALERRKGALHNGVLVPVTRSTHAHHDVHLR